MNVLLRMIRALKEKVERQVISSSEPFNRGGERFTEKTHTEEFIVGSKATSDDEECNVFVTASRRLLTRTSTLPEGPELTLPDQDLAALIA